ncbi:alginate lyase 2 [Podospora didyma]|uniref:Alginate lyase 2 n=1 Tax=Podospora didyma TaxID=330526 RepID=A0AAE0P8G2_9PEZI|nr:alginate lyase 2 [Podospora didyma]
MARTTIILVVSLYLNAYFKLTLAACPKDILDLRFLQLPTGRPGSPDSIQTSSLEGCFSNGNFFAGGDNSIVMKVPGTPANSGCVTTPNSLHCRTELHETSSWQPTSAVNSMTADLVVVNAGGSTCIGQIHIDESLSTKPALQIYYNSNGAITVGVERQRSGGGQVITPVGKVSPGVRFSYEVR